MTRGLQLVTSNRMEALVERLAVGLRSRLQNPFEPETIVVQSLGMARWLQLELARLNGVCALTRFPFPKAFIREVCCTVLLAAKGEPRFERDALTWRVWSALAADPEKRFAESTRYSAGDPRRQFQLATRVAGLLDQYLVYRPELIATWDAGADESWQAAVWRAVRGGPEAWPESRLLRTTLEHLAAAAPAGLPERVAIFGIPALPPVYLELLAALARHTEVTLYQLQPCREFWAEAVTSREEQRNLRRAGRRADEGAELHLERGHRLLTSLGRLGRSFLAQLAEHGAGSEEDPALVPFVDPGEDTLLHALQSDLLNLRDRTDPAVSRLIFGHDDASLRIHACHSPRRELEVLHDQLLAALDADPTLAPRDVLVLTPDIEGYAPLIQAVFGAPEEERLRLPFTLADRAPRVESPLADAFLRLLELPGHRFGRSEVLPLLDLAALQRRFGFTPAELPRLREWLTDLRVSWGLDAAQRGAQGLPALPQGTWRHGTDRLLLGYAMAPDDEAVFADVSPFSPVEGDGADLAGRIAELVAALEQLPVRLAADRSLAAWADELGVVLETFFAPDPDSEGDFGLVRSLLARLRTAGSAAEFTGVVPLAAVVEQLRPWFEDSEKHVGGFLRGGITFAALKPMRSVPARVVAVLGLNDGTFPRRANPLSFDLIAAHPRPGDESREADDRYLFLETLLSARDRLHLSHVGQSTRDNAPLPPSVVLSELIDYLAEAVEGGTEAVADRVVVRHPLHAFSPVYFNPDGDPRLFSYSRENSRAALVAPDALRIGEIRGPFCAQALPEPEGAWRSLDVATLARFLMNPAKFFLRERLGLQLPETDDGPDDREVFALDRLAAYGVKQAWLELARAGRPTASLARRLAADGALPLGPAATLEARAIGTTVTNLVAALSADECTPEPPVPVNLTVGDFTLTGQVTELTRAGLRLVRPAKFKAGELLRSWVGQIALAAARPETPAPPARLVTEDQIWRIAAPSDPRAVLTDLLALYAAGLRRPLPFFPKSAWAFTHPESAQAKQSPLERALSQWSGSWDRPGEEQEPAYAFCFGAVVPHPLDEEFQTLARRVFQPLRAVAEKETGTA